MGNRGSEAELMGSIAVAPSIPGALPRSTRWLVSLALLAITLAMTVPIYGGWLGDRNRESRFGFALLWGALALATTRIKRLRRFSGMFLCLFGVSLGLALAFVVGSRPIHYLGLSTETPKGAAVDKIFGEVIPLCAAVLLAALLGRRGLASLGLRGGRPRQSLGLGLLASLPLLALFIFDPSGGREAVFSTPPILLRSWIPWIVLFSIANGFSEELWFRGLWLGGFKDTLGATAAMHVTSLAFCLMHVIVYWGDPVSILMLTPPWLFMGYAYAWIMRKTGSLWGPALTHAIADVLFLLVAFSSGKM
jgi:membrane protease YdiL (CAAX protease family)